MTQVHRSRRRVLRHSPMAEEVNELAGWYDWPVVHEAQPDPGKGKGYEVNWGILPTLVLGYLESLISNDCCVVAVGKDATEVEVVIERIDQDLADEIEPVDGLLAAIQPGGDPRELARGLVRAGFGAPVECDPEFFSAFGTAIRDHPEPRVRDIAISSLVFMEWPEFRPVLEEVVASEPELQIRERAAGVLAAYRAVGM